MLLRQSIMAIGETGNHGMKEATVMISGQLQEYDLKTLKEVEMTQLGMA